MQGKGDKGQKGRYIFTPLHTSSVAWRGFYICDSTGREHTHKKKKKKQAQRKIKKNECIYVLLYRPQTIWPTVSQI